MEKIIDSNVALSWTELRFKQSMPAVIWFFFTLLHLAKFELANHGNQVELSL